MSHKQFVEPLDWFMLLAAAWESQLTDSECESLQSYARAIASISTGTPFGSSLTATQDRAGLWVKYCSYTLFISAKFDMDVKKTVT